MFSWRRINLNLMTPKIERAQKMGQPSWRVLSESVNTGVVHSWRKGSQGPKMGPRNYWHSCALVS